MRDEGVISVNKDRDPNVLAQFTYPSAVVVAEMLNIERILSTASVNTAHCDSETKAFCRNPDRYRLPIVTGDPKTGTQATACSQIRQSTNVAIQGNNECIGHFMATRLETFKAIGARIIRDEVIIEMGESGDESFENRKAYLENIGLY